MLRATFAKSAVANVPASKAARENHLHRVWALTFFAAKAGGETKLTSGTTQQPAEGLGQQSFAGAIHQPQALFTVEGKDSHVNFRHHGAQQCVCFESADSLLAECLAKIVHFEHNFAERIARCGAPSTNRIVAFTNGGQNV